MFDIGLPELIIIFVVALLVFGPKRLPELAKALGKGMGELKRAFQDVKEQVDTEFEETSKTLDIAIEGNKISDVDQKTNNNKHTTDNKPV
ncbi:MAG: twin-arginine translocase subunit TatB [Nitrospirae bacterium CG_4_10_14_0_8_um_filter_41_23]|nr:twin-arginine translocase subunit TatB [Nitrospirota bacterium]PIQ94527.1 MAG: twin-arginine translocase subunit TatB [Nitrospirae bacterium CG11_big_fil_rev_8_21_14_0_20_41_14]PIV42918.1 MAG: twin-arginine translocase subunit TatB [Nitrospirae bacterium CG02_land_8_20_14_3_00_41_53]PIW87799.1 MAG: twin-arginine translocase subunit TatB [Nitrospirae bacterium CG_4_8_14_3_um_filter_41_47]PIY86910.1 MAG: twin-arginine translocase subunit TatB [Nitrospirae bacterium CG_4_10_14_0_8_um_filter_41_